MDKNNLIVFLPPRIMARHEEYVRIEKVIRNCEIVLSCREKWTTMEREGEIETPFYELIKHAESRRIELLIAEKKLLQEIGVLCAAG